MMEGTKNQKQAGSKIKTLQVPLSTGNIKENIVLTTNSYSNLSKEQIIRIAHKTRADLVIAMNYKGENTQ